MLMEKSLSCAIVSEPSYLPFGSNLANSVYP